jgi:hypothetical protein
MWKSADSLPLFFQQSRRLGNGFLTTEAGIGKMHAFVVRISCWNHRARTLWVSLRFLRHLQKCPGKCTTTVIWPVKKNSFLRLGSHKVAVLSGIPVQYLLLSRFTSQGFAFFLLPMDPRVLTVLKLARPLLKLFFCKCKNPQFVMHLSDFTILFITQRHESAGDSDITNEVSMPVCS